MAVAARELSFDLQTAYTPTLRQRAFHSCPADIVLYGGAAGGGKSEALLWEAFIQCLEVPGNRALLLRRKYPELYRTLIERSLAKFPDDKKLGSNSLCYYAVTKKEWRFKNGSVLEFGFCEREQDVYQYDSAEYGFIGVDELTHWTHLQFNYLQSRLRSVVPGAWPRIRAASNPGNIGHAWVKDFFKIGKLRSDTVWENEHRQLISFLPATVYDNPYIMRYDPGYIRRLMQLDEKWRKALLEGNWEVFAGQYFHMWDPDVHVFRDMPIPHWWKRFRSLDYGLDCTACYWWAIAQDGRAYIYRELYEPDLSLSQAAQRIKEMTPVGEKVSYTVASPDLWNRRQDTGLSGYEIMTRAGLTGLVKADDRRVPGWRALREYLDPYEDNGQQVARLTIAETCPELIRTLPALVHDDRNPNDVADSGEDHAGESVRYGVMSRPPRGVPEKEEQRQLRLRERRIRPVVSAVTGY